MPYTYKWTYCPFCAAWQGRRGRLTCVACGREMGESNDPKLISALARRDAKRAGETPAGETRT